MSSSASSPITHTAADPDVKSADAEQQQLQRCNNDLLSKDYFPLPLSQSGRRSSTPLCLEGTYRSPPPKGLSIAYEVKSHSTSTTTTPPTGNNGPEAVLSEQEDAPLPIGQSSDHSPYNRRPSMSLDSVIPPPTSAFASVSASFVSVLEAATSSQQTNIHPTNNSSRLALPNNNNTIIINNNNNNTTAYSPSPSSYYTSMLPPSQQPQRLPARPASSLLGDRSISTSIRLRRQGFRPKSTCLEFAVRSIRRGSAEWHTLLRPFVADLVFRSIEYHRRHQHSNNINNTINHHNVSFRRYTCQAAVLFVDLSNYSGITSLIAHRGAHALSNIVNAYFKRLLHIVRRYGGDVVKFAGDAVLVVWEGSEDDLPIHSLIAATCAMEMQRQAGVHAVEGTPLSFRIHCGVCCGTLESEVFAAPTSHHMQRLYHSVGGESLLEIGEAVNLAAAGQVCITERVADFLKPKAKCVELEETGFYILETLTMDEGTTERIETHVENSASERMMRRNRKIEEDFIHPSVLRLLGHGGLNPTQIAQMRNLCILFIAKTSSGSSVNWLMEVQTILDRRRCPIVQIIDDDKAVHVVAAVNLYEAIPETSLKGIEVCSDLTKQQVGCAIGMASGPTFCGVTGCATVACRWDITGGPAVRAARLMQYALAMDITVAIDQSVYDNPLAAARMVLLTEEAELKGTHYSVPVYTVSDSEKLSAFRVLETVHGRVHDDKVKIIVEHIKKSNGRAAVIVIGPPLAGKKIVCQRAAGYAELVPYLHLSEDSAGFLQLARTIATWFKYVDNEDIQLLSTNVLNHLEMQRWSRAHDECLLLINTAMQEGLKACFLIDRIQFLDDFSMSLLRGCLNPRWSRSNSRSSTVSNSESGSGPTITDYMGCIVFLCVHNELYHWRAARDIGKDLAHSSSSAVLPIVEVGEAPQEQLGKLFSELADMGVHERWTSTLGDACGNCAGYLIEKAAAIRKKVGIGWSKGKDGSTQINDSLKLTISPGFLKKVYTIPVSQVNPEIAMKFSQIFDQLPPLMQIVLKIMSIASRVTFYHLPRVIVWETLNDLVAEGVELGVFGVLVEELRDMFLVKLGHDEGKEVISFQCRALGDTAFAVSTPVQIEAIAKALLERLEIYREEDFRVPFLLASLEILLDPIDKGFFVEDDDSDDNNNHIQNTVIPLWQQGYKMFLRKSSCWDEELVELWKERFADELQDSGLNLSFAKVFDEEFYIRSWGQASIDQALSRAKVYTPPLAFGPMGHSLAVIGRTIFHEYGKFRGYAEAIHTRNSSDLKSASMRYIAETFEVEQLLTEYGFSVDCDVTNEERRIVAKIAEPAESAEDVLQKAKWFIENLVDTFVVGRLDRLYKLVDKLRTADIMPPIMNSAQPEICRAFMAIRKIRSEQDAAQDALMILATSNWKPKKVPEHLPILLYQSVARLRNKTLKQLTAAELAIAKHQQCDIDLEAFLIVTPLLYKAHDRSDFPYDSRSASSSDEPAI